MCSPSGAAFAYPRCINSKVGMAKVQPIQPKNRVGFNLPRWDSTFQGGIQPSKVGFNLTRWDSTFQGGIQPYQVGPAKPIIIITVSKVIYGAPINDIKIKKKAGNWGFFTLLIGVITYDSIYKLVGPHLVTTFHGKTLLTSSRNILVGTILCISFC